MKSLVVYFVMFLAGVARTHASSATRVWYGYQGGTVTLPCGNKTTPVGQCSWTVPLDDSGTCSGTRVITMSSIISGQHPGLAAAGGDRPCDLRLDNLTRGNEGLWTCGDITFQLLVNGVLVPTFFADGRQKANGSLLSTLTNRDHTLQCSVLWSRPAANIQWLVGDQNDVSDQATTASSPAGTSGGLGSCPAVEGDSTWQVSSSLPVSFEEGDQRVLCVVSHPSLPDDLAISMRLEVDNGAEGLKLGTMNAKWCLLATATVLLSSLQKVVA